MHDVVIIGGSYAGLSAALQLGRARCDVVIVDAGERRSRFSTHSHGFLGRDGASGEEIADSARSEVLRYPTVSWSDGKVTQVSGTSDAFVVRTQSDELHTKRVIIATGVVDELPAIAGLTERWGRTVFHCPFSRHGVRIGRDRFAQNTRVNLRELGAHE
ncbi:MAG: hypothetical protein RL701_1966 [Pseudomonadota bacterium]